MALTAGTMLGPYAVVAPLGAGGMGEVYRARDRKLERDVAVKVLPSHLAEHPAALARFEREAKAVAALSHPNVLAIFDFGRAGDRAYAVMELLDGETLRDKLAAPISIRKAIDYGVQIARGLAAAHGKGIVHRDLKPENVFVTIDGRVKILDFGLARQTTALAAADATVSPTLEPQTDPGTVLGTVGYMSPEQARGEPGDSRSDLFSLGAVLYEVVSGRRAFQRETAAETLTAILREDPPDLTSSSAAGVSPGLARVVQHCLEKNPAERFQSASDVVFALENLSEASTSGVHTAATASGKRRTWLPWSVAALTAIVSTALMVVPIVRPAPVVPLTRLSVPFPKDIPYALGFSPHRNLAISPDGSRIVYVSSSTPSQRQIFSRLLDRVTIEPIAGTEGAYQPFFSPDGKWLAFFTAGGELRKVSTDGGRPVTLARGLPNSQRGFGVWRADNIIVFSVFGPLQQVSGDGGTPTQLTSLRTAGTDFHHFPQVVRATADILYASSDESGTKSLRLDLFRWNTHESSTVIEGASAAIITASGHIVFDRDATMMVAAFDARRGVAGAAVPLPDAVLADDAQWRSAELAVSTTGTMVYVPAIAAKAATIGWIDRAGAFTEVGRLPGSRANAALSPDGNTAAVLLSRRVLLFDLVRRVTTPVDLGSRQPDTVGWHPDGNRIVLGGGRLSLFDRDTAMDTLLSDLPGTKRFATWSRDRRTVAYMTFSPNEDIYTLSLDKGAKPRPFLATAAIESNPSISPDGRWMAYTSTRPGEASLMTDVYVVRFPEGTGKVQITNGGGGPPFWNSDSRELFFTAPPGVLQSVSISSSSADRPEVGPARTLFPLNGSRIGGVAPDGRRFLAVRLPPAEAPTEMVVVQNWFQELARLAPAGP